jgi:hypothetical protein
MTRLRWVAALVMALAAVAPFWADDGKKDDFVPLFNGKDLSGWVNVNCAPSTFFVKKDEIITTGHPTGYLRTDRQYENFIAEFDWMHVPDAPGAVGNSGFFVWADPLPAVGTGYSRGIEVQVLVNLTYRNKKNEITATSQGDLFSIWGATCVPDRPHPDGWARCLPSEDRCKGANEWNHYRVEANDGVIKLAVNGKVVSGVSKCKPRKGYLALESEGSECRFRNLKIKDLPSTNPKPDEVADVAQGHRNLYTGLDLDGWKEDGETKAHWQPQDWILHGDGKAELRSENELAAVEIITDFQFLKEGAKKCEFVINEGSQGKVIVAIEPNGRYDVRTFCGNETLSGSGTGPKLKEWNRLRVTYDKMKVKVFVNNVPLTEHESQMLPLKGTYAVHPTGPMNFGNLFVLEKGK